MPKKITSINDIRGYITILRSIQAECSLRGDTETVDNLSIQISLLRGVIYSLSNNPGTLSHEHDLIIIDTIRVIENYNLATEIYAEAIVTPIIPTASAIFQGQISILDNDSKSIFPIPVANLVRNDDNVGSTTYPSSPIIFPSIDHEARFTPIGDVHIEEQTSNDVIVSEGGGALSSIVYILCFCCLCLIGEDGNYNDYSSR